MLSSENILTARNASSVQWELLPAGEHGLRPVGGDRCDWPAAAVGCVAEEFHVVPLFETPGFFAVFRTVTGAHAVTGPHWQHPPATASSAAPAANAMMADALAGGRCLRRARVRQVTSGRPERLTRRVRLAG